MERLEVVRFFARQPAQGFSCSRSVAFGQVPNPAATVFVKASGFVARIESMQLVQRTCIGFPIQFHGRALDLNEIFWLDGQCAIQHRFLIRVTPRDK